MDEEEEEEEDEQPHHPGGGAYTGVQNQGNDPYAMGRVIQHRLICGIG